MKDISEKTLIELAASYEDANTIIEKFTGLKSYSEKIKYLTSTFDCTIFDRIIDNEEADYMSLLTHIINMKWERGR